MGQRSGENPARWRGHLDQLLPKRQRLSRDHHTALPYDAMPDFMADLRARGGVATQALEFAILSAARSGEVLGAQWAEIDREKKVWTIPAARMKAGREHRVPLTPRAMEIADAMTNLATGAHLFPGPKPGKPLSSMAMVMLLRRMKAEITVHGFRSTFRDWASETTGFPHEVCEMALAHTIGNKAEVPIGAATCSTSAASTWRRGRATAPGAPGPKLCPCGSRSRQPEADRTFSAPWLGATHGSAWLRSQPSAGFDGCCPAQLS